MKKITSEGKIALLFAIGVVFMIYGVIKGDYATTKAGWTFGDIIAWTGLASFIGAFIWLVVLNKSSKSEKPE
jgi:uncharacterized membrane protein